VSVFQPKKILSLGSAGLLSLVLISATGVFGAAEPGLFITEPHRPVIFEGQGYPVVRILVGGDGSIRGSVIRLDSRIYGDIDPSFDPQITALISNFSVRANREERLVIQGVPPGTGRYVFELSYNSPEGGANRSIPFTVLPQNEAATGVRMDSYGTCYRNGRPWLPMVIYTNSAASKNGGTGSQPLDSARDQFLDYFENTPFAMMDYCAPRAGISYALDYLNRCRQRGILMSMHAAPTVLDLGEVRQFAEQLRDHSALVFWYINDELGNDWYEELKETRLALLRHDPFHPTHVQHYDMDKYMEQTETYDIYVHQFYNGGVRQIRQNFQYMIDLADLSPAGIPFWGNMFLSDDKLRTMSYGCIANGAKGLMYYGFHVMRDSAAYEDDREAFNRRWNEIVEIGREIESRQHILLQPPTPVQSTANVDELALRTVSGEHGTWLLIANPYWQTRQVRITLGVAAESATGIDGTAYEVRNNQIEMAVTPEDVWLIRLHTVAEEGSGDLNGDGVTNFLDLAEFARGQP